MPEENQDAKLFTSRWGKAITDDLHRYFLAQDVHVIYDMDCGTNAGLSLLNNSRHKKI